MMMFHKIANPRRIDAGAPRRCRRPADAGAAGARRRAPRSRTANPRRTTLMEMPVAASAAE
ncbi:hypothetical protein LV779_36875 [Streptomyces thinghirensis]|nr:hypothetical protein [Streptomyces thinghirensis]